MTASLTFAHQDLEPALAAVEQGLHDLSLSLQASDPSGIDQHAADLQTALTQALDIFGHAAHFGPIPPRQRQRLMQAAGQVAAHREALARATAALDRAMDVLMPKSSPVYGPQGYGERRALVATRVSA
jgi:hypothetical protein